MLNRNLEDPVRPRAVGSGSELEMERGELRRFGPAQVDDDEGAPASR